MIRTYLANETSVNIRESECRIATKYICFQSVSSCITITLVNDNVMVGIHCTTADNASDIRKVILDVKSKIANEFSNCYIIGALPIFKTRVRDSSICTRKKIVTLIKSHINIFNEIAFHDTTIHHETKKNTHIFIRDNPFNVSYCAAHDCLVSAQEPPLSVRRKYIPLAQFEKIRSVSNIIFRRF